MNNLFALILFSLALIPIQHADAAREGPVRDTKNQETFEQKTILEEAEAFFGEGAAGLADVVARVFEEQGRPNAYIKGEEAGGAIGIGVRYGNGTLVLKRGGTRQVHWQGPSIGFDVGANVVKVFVLIYNLPDIESIFQRYPGVEGSLYFVAGIGVNYLQSGDIVLAPIRFGVGWRLGASAGYMHITREKSWIPF